MKEHFNCKTLSAGGRSGGRELRDGMRQLVGFCMQMFERIMLNYWEFVILYVCARACMRACVCVFYSSLNLCAWMGEYESCVCCCSMSSQI